MIRVMGYKDIVSSASYHRDGVLTGEKRLRAQLRWKALDDSETRGWLALWTLVTTARLGDGGIRGLLRSKRKGVVGQ
jgi:hypothetical protein